MTRTASPQDMRRAEAALWRTRLDEEPSLALSPEYLEWSSRPGNRGMADEADEAWALFDDIAVAPEMLSLRQAALADVRRSAGRRFRPSARMAAAVAAGVCLLAVSATAWSLSPKVYRTDIGERRVVLLEDGSRISLDAASEVRVRYTRGARQLQLSRGQARFDIAQDARRPFVVDAGERSVTASRGAFNIDRAAQKICVTLLDGAAVVRLDAGLFQRPAPGRPLLLKAGQRLTAASSATAVASADVTEATAWEHGELVFADEPLTVAVARVNRYSARTIVVDPGAASLRISGAFDAGDTDSFLDAMSSYFHLDAVPEPDGKVVLQRRS